MFDMTKLERAIICLLIVVAKCAYHSATTINKQIKALCNEGTMILNLIYSTYNTT